MPPSQELPYRLFPERSKTVNDIIDFSRLPQGWHYGQGGPISRQVCVWALQLYRHATNVGFSVTETFPGVNREVMVSVYHGRHTLDFTINPDGTIDFRHEFGDDDVEVAENLSLDAAKRKLTTLGMSWSLSALFIQDTLVMKPANSKTLSSSQAKTAGGSRLLTKNVDWQLVDHFVST